MEGGRMKADMKGTIFYIVLKVKDIFFKMHYDE
jgi:hypothetical protein